MRDVIFSVHRACLSQLTARAEEGNHSIDAQASSSMDLHQQAREALKESLGEKHSECRIRLVQSYPDLRRLRCTYWPCLGTTRN
jgi:hypothetical protein